jgi:putative membrane protein
MLDLILAIAHHLLIFGIFGILFVEFMTVRPGLGIPAVLRLASIDRWYGAFAGAVLVVGFCRAIFAAKGWTYYSRNDTAVLVARRYLHIELALFVFLPIFAAAMSRGYGEF